MANLQSILLEASDQRLDAGGAVSAKLIANLRAYRKQQFWIFVVIETVLIVGVGLCAYYLTLHPSRTIGVKVLAGFIGVGAGGGIEVMRRIWKEWSQTDLLLAMVSGASEAQVTLIIDKLIKKV
jgi:hypothetical protein